MESDDFDVGELVFNPMTGDYEYENLIGRTMTGRYLVKCKLNKSDSGWLVRSFDTVEEACNFTNSDTMRDCYESEGWMCNLSVTLINMSDIDWSDTRIVGGHGEIERVGGHGGTLNRIDLDEVIE